MEHKKFLEKYDWKFYNYDTVYWPECVDLFKGYYRDVKLFTINVSLGAAKNYWKYIEKAGFTRTTTPVQWDATFTDYTQWWHVGIFERFWKNGVEWFYQFDQIGNWEKVGGEKPCKLRFYPMSKLLWFATINKPMKHLQQGWEKDCSLSSVVNCYILNNGVDSKKINQEVLNWWMVEYINKHPKDAFNFLKGKWYNIKLLPLNFNWAKVRLSKWSAVVFYIKWDSPLTSHWTCMKQVDGKYLIYDSTRPDVVEITDIDTPYKNWVFTDKCFQIR